MKTHAASRSLAQAALMLCALLGLIACAADMWIPIEVAPRTAVSAQHVQYLEEAPTKPFHAIGIITPPEDEYETEAEAVNAIRIEAAKHGADAVIIERGGSETVPVVPRFKWDSTSKTIVHLRAKAIVFD